MTTTTWRRRLGLGLAAVTALAALTGCSLDRLGSAAVVGGRPISTDRVQDLTREYLEALPNQDSGPVQRGILDQLITTEVYAQVSRDLGVHVSAGRVADQLERLVEQFRTRKDLALAIQTNQAEPEYVAPSMLEAWMRNQLTFGAVARKLNGGSIPEGDTVEQVFGAADREITAAAERIGVEVNPRYGRWSPDRAIDPTVSTIVPLVSGGLSRTEQELARRSRS